MRLKAFQISNHSQSQSKIGWHLHFLFFLLCVVCTVYIVGVSFEAGIWDLERCCMGFRFLPKVRDLAIRGGVVHYIVG